MDQARTNRLGMVILDRTLNFYNLKYIYMSDLKRTWTSIIL